ncbi:MAG TPA: serine hydrolase, partial [Flavobacteriales bacterium]|nr:serine hydrolase [Flavobacteriales bacterium]
MMWTKKVPVYAVAAAWVIGAGGCFLLMSHKEHRPAPRGIRTVVPAAQETPCTYNIQRLKGFSYISPLVSAEPECESPRMHDMKQAIIQAIDTFRAAGVLQKASVYVRDFKRGDWITVNGNETYDPGSMLKVPVMMTYLKMAEEDPQLFNHSMRYTPVEMPGAAFPASAMIAEGTDYTVPDLLKYTIERSDNRANLVLLQNINMDMFHHTFTDLGLPDFETGALFYPMTAPDYATFFKVLYNSSLLSPRTSEYAMELLLHSEFQQGLLQGIPEGVQVAHKFGEAGDRTMGQLHESGIVYLKNDPYLIVVMTKGTDIHALPHVLGSISSIVYDSISGA